MPAKPGAGINWPSDSGLPPRSPAKPQVRSGAYQLINPGVEEGRSASKLAPIPEEQNQPPRSIQKIMPNSKAMMSKPEEAYYNIQDSNVG